MSLGADFIKDVVLSLRLIVDPARHRAATPIDAKQTVYLCEVTDRVEKKKIKEEEKEKER